MGSSTETVTDYTYYTYDSLGRLIKTKDPRPASGTAVTTISYYLDSEKSNAGAYVGKEKTISDPLGQVTTLTYYRNESWHSSPAGSLMTSSNPNAETTQRWYDWLGRVTHQWGTNSYPVKYIYDTSDGTGTFNELEEMQTYRTGSWSGSPSAGLPSGFSGVGDKTIWTYGGGSGLLLSKSDTNGTVPYNYISGTTLVSTIERPRALSYDYVTTTFAYDDLGRVLTRTHSDSTPTVTYAYTRDGRVATVSDAAGLHTFTETGTTSTRLRSEAITGTGALSGLTLEDTVGIAGEQTKLTVKKGVASLTETTYAYDNSKNRVTTATETIASLSGAYVYVAKSDLISTVSLKKSGTTKVTQTSTYNANKDRLLSISNSHASGVVSSQGYPDANHDAVDRRKRVDNEDGTFWEYVYNTRGEVTSGILKHGTTTPVTLPGWSYSYAYDTMGNRTSVGGTSGTGTYTINNRNQITSVTDGNVYVVKGRAPTSYPAPTIHVDYVSQTVTQQTAGSFDYFKSDVSKSGPDYDTVSVSSGGDSGTWYKFVPPTTDSRTYDYSGNLKTDWRWTYEWDAYDRVVKMVTQASAVSGGLPNYTLDFVYDHLGRRVRKTVKLGTSTITDTKFVYNGWNLVAELNALSSDALVRSYLWGADLSGTQQGAGGVGGLLAIRQVAGTATDQMVCMDGNGNIMALVDAAVSTSAAIKARYTYDAFGQKCRAYGSFTTTNPFGFSTKYEDRESGLLYYGYRYQDPVQGRWLNRDPIEEEGGLNLYGFNINDPINLIDILGLDWKKKGPTADKRRMKWRRSNLRGDTLEELAEKVKLAPGEVSAWAKEVSGSYGFEYSVPNVWISGQLLDGRRERGIVQYFDWLINTGDEIGNAATLTKDKLVVSVGDLRGMVPAIRKYSGDIIALSLYAHGSPGLVVQLPRGRRPIAYLHQQEMIDALVGNGFRISVAYLMQCFSGANGFDRQWRERTVHGAHTYQGVNCLGIDVRGPQSPRERHRGPQGPRHRR